MTILTVRHSTVYRYRLPVGFGDHRMMFRPRDGYDQKVLDETLTIIPEPKQIRWLYDVFANFVAVTSQLGTHRMYAAAARRTPGARFTCRAPVGWNLIRPMALSETVI